ncbi:MAG: response regulator [Chitinophagales bacterium]
MAERFSITMTDDDSEDQFLVRTVLDDLDYKIDFNTLNNGEELVTHLEHELTNGKNFPSLILLDINMPGKNGKDILRYIKNKDVIRNIPVIMFSTGRDVNQIKQCYQLGANSYISKPSSYSKLVEVMGNICSFWFNYAKVPGRYIPMSGTYSGK